MSFEHDLPPRCQAGPREAEPSSRRIVKPVMHARHQCVPQRLGEMTVGP
ncbi:Hypothetical protein A7982_00957 [Minicystis rosea]|nr:Hypothetical protein A7982_00957 [Minicystis rosea]